MTANQPMTTTLGAVAEFINGGAWSQTEYSGEGVPVVRVTDIKDETVDLSDCKFLPKSALNKYRKHLLRAGDLVICTVGSHPTQPGSVVGRPAIIPIRAHGSFLNQNAVCIRASSPDLDQLWLGYLGRSSKFHDYVKSCARGAANQVRMAIGLFKEMPIDVPPLPVQRRIAGILSAYDELIENSQRRIRLLEDMARALYREWFVHFRFPGHDSVPRLPSALGDIPQGWEVKKLGDIADVNRAQINVRSAPEELHYIDISSVSPGRIDSSTTYTFADAPGRARRIVQHGDILWSCVRPNRRSHALVMHPEPETIASTGFAVLTPSKVPFPFLYFATTTDEFVKFLENSATGAAYPAVSAKTFEEADLLVPPSNMLEAFAKSAIPMAEEIHTLHLQIQNLRRTRDLLLPRLLSGRTTRIRPAL